MPSRSDWYVMQLTAATVSSEDKPKQPGDMLIKFKWGRETEADKRKVDAQFKEWEKVGVKVPKRMTAADIGKYLAWARMAEIEMQGVKR